MARLAVVGVGYWGPNLIRNFLACDGIDGVIACDRDPSRLAVAARQFHGIECTSSIDAILARTDVEAVAISTPVHLHHQLAKAALVAGKHVLLEKPITLSSREALDLIESADRGGRVLMVDHTFIYHGAVERIAEIVHRGELGDFYYIDSVRINLGLFQHDVNVVWDLAPHDLSIAAHILRRRPRVVRATGQSHLQDGVENVAYLNVEYGDNIVANFHVNWLSPTKIRHMIFAGSRKMIVWNDLDPDERLRIYDKGVELTEMDTNGLHERRVGYRLGDTWLPRLDQGEPLRKMAAHFLECIHYGRKPLTGGAEGLDVVLTLEAAGMSLSNQGRPVAIEGERLSLL